MPALTDEEYADIDGAIIRLMLEDPGERIAAAERLARHGPRARMALAYLIDCLVDDRAEVASACGRAAAAIGPAAIDALERIATRAPLEDRLRAIDTLALMGAAARDALERIHDHTCERSDDEALRTRLAAALTKVDHAVSRTCPLRDRTDVT